MTENRKTKAQLLAELEDVRQQLCKYVAAESDAVKAEEVLWESQIALLALFNNLPGMAYRTARDPLSGRRHVEFVSGGCLRLTGYAANAYISNPTFYRSQIVHPDDREQVDHVIDAAEKEHRPYALTYRIIRADGDIRWFDEHGTGLYDAKQRLTAREGFINDVTESVSNVEEIRRQNDRLQKLTRAVEQAHELIVIGDASGNVQYVNAAFERITGHGRDELIGKPAFMSTVDSNDSNLFATIRPKLVRGDVWRGNYLISRKDGTLLEVEATLSPVFSDHQSFDGYVAQQRDASCRPWATMTDSATQRLELLGLVAGTFVRDFNNQLQAIIGYGQLALEGTPAEHGSQGYLSRILQAAGRAREANANLLDFLQSDQEGRRVTDFGDLCTRAGELVGGSLPVNLRIETRIEGADLWVEGRPNQLCQMVVLLLINACRSVMPAGGSVRMGVALMQPSTEGKAAAAGGAGERIECRIGGVCHPEAADPGKHPSESPAVPPFPALSLDLEALAAAISEHGGTLSSPVTTPSGDAQEWILSLPLAGAPPAAEPATSLSPSGEAPPPAPGAHIMFVDDEEMLTELAQIELEDIGYRVSPFTSALDALAAFEQDPDAVDLVIADQTMPGMTGFQLARKMLRRCPALPIILITGYSEVVNDLRARAIGIRNYLIKPITPEKLAQAVEQALNATGDGPR